MRQFITMMVAAVIVGSLPASASAHAMLERADPRVGAVIKASPTDVRLEFSEAVEASLSRITLADARGANVALGPATALPADKRVLTAPVRTALIAGAYLVTWRVVSVDSHVTQGQFSFTVKP